MKVGLVIKRLSCVSVIIAVVSLPRILAGLFPLHSSGVTGDPVMIEAGISAPHALGERREEAKSSDRPVRAPSTERAMLQFVD